MEIGESIETCMNNYATFTGRASRSEFWWFFLFTLMASAAVSTISHMHWIVDLIQLVLLLPNLAAATRRLHDTGRSGWWQLLYLTIIGSILVWILLCLQSHPQPNEYGPPVQPRNDNQPTPN
jgi:uncharacterized membrane protein YhaH (DUF805 family)